MPTLVRHGAKSDLLSQELTIEMRKRNRNSELIRLDECGHVPPLMEKGHVDIVAKFMQGTSGKQEIREIR